jgi:hypothetical protein
VLQRDACARFKLASHRWQLVRAAQRGFGHGGAGHAATAARVQRVARGEVLRTRAQLLMRKLHHACQPTGLAWLSGGSSAADC